jgi:hypothetical protein
VSLYLRVRGAFVIAAVAAAVVALLAWPGSFLSATPSPTGATMMAGAFFAIAVPAVIGWGCARGDSRLEATGARASRRTGYPNGLPMGRPASGGTFGE